VEATELQSVYKIGFAHYVLLFCMEVTHGQLMVHNFSRVPHADEIENQIGNLFHVKLIVLVFDQRSCSTLGQVKTVLTLDPLRTLAIPEHLIRGVFTTKRYTNPRLPYLTLPTL